jgi:DNA-binding SARP family transcriptional activator/tetratricopeptide (TPR) repeat protein/DNA-binding XRE family transcriptional regulator
VENRDFATWLRETRLAAGLSQAKLAERTGVAVRTIRHLENGQVSQPRAATEQSLRQALAPAGAGPGTRHGTGTGVQVRVLGPVQLRVAGRRVALGGMERRALLGYLAVRAGETVPAGELLDIIWDGGQAAKLPALQSHVSRLRRLLAQAPGTPSGMRLEYAGGYRLVAGNAQVDLLTVRDAVRRARATPSSEAAFGALAPAIGQVGGAVLADLPGLSEEPAVIAAAEEIRAAVRYFAELCTETGEPAAAIGPLRAAFAAAPFDEDLCAQLMTALAAAGRQAEALKLFHTLRERLVDELGVDPGDALAAALDQVLRGGEGLAPDASPAGPPPVPAQLPAAVEDFTGRDEQVRQVRELLIAAAGPGTRVIAVCGTGGAGKTTLAVHAAHLVRDHFPDGQLFADLRGVGDQPVGAAEVLGRFLTALGVASLPADPDERAALFRSLLTDRRVLVLLDNARDASQVAPLIPGTPGNAALVTSRNAAAGPPGAHLIAVPPFGRGESLGLLARIVGTARVSADPAAADKVAAACGDLPLAIRVAGTRLTAHRQWTVGDLADRLTGGRRLDELSQALSVRACFQLSYGLLDEEAATAFRRLGSWPTTDISAATVAAMLGTSAAHAERVLDRLSGASLAEAAQPGRYRLHDLLHDYAADLYRQLEPPGDRAATEDRVLRFAAAAAQQANRQLYPSSPRPADDIVSSPYALTFASHQDAYAWLGDELAGLSALVARAADSGGADARVAAALAMSLVSYLRLRRGEQAGEQILDAGMALRDRIPGTGLATQVLIARGITLIYTGRAGQARSCFEQALAETRRLPDSPWQAKVIECLGYLDLWTGDYQGAERHCAAAAERYRGEGNTFDRVVALVGLAQALLYQGRGQEAERSAREVIELAHATGDLRHEGVGWGVLADALNGQERFDEAISAGRKSLTAGRASGDDVNEPDTLRTLARACRGNGNLRTALEFCLAAFNKLEHQPADLYSAETLTELGHILRALGRADEAALRWKTALDQYEQLGHPDAKHVAALLGPLEPGQRGRPSETSPGDETGLSAVLHERPPVAVAARREEVIGQPARVLDRALVRDAPEPEMIPVVGGAAYPAINPHLCAIAEYRVGVCGRVLARLGPEVQRLARRQGCHLGAEKIDGFAADDGGGRGRGGDRRTDRQRAGRETERGTGRTQPAPQPRRVDQ